MYIFPQFSTRYPDLQVSESTSHVSYIYAPQLHNLEESLYIVDNESIY